MLWTVLWHLVLKFPASAGRKLHVGSSNTHFAAWEHHLLESTPSSSSTHLGLRASCLIIAMLASKSTLLKWPSRIWIFFFSPRKSWVWTSQCCQHLPASWWMVTVPALCNVCIPETCLKLVLCTFGNHHFIVYVYINYCSCLIPFLFEMVPDNPDKQPHSDRAYRYSCKDGSGSGLGHTGPWPILHSSKQITPVYIFLLYSSLGRRPIATFTVTDSIWTGKIYFPFLNCSRIPPSPVRISV